MAHNGRYCSTPPAHRILLLSPTLLASHGVQGQRPCRSARCPRKNLFSFVLCRLRRHKTKTNKVGLERSSTPEKSKNNPKAKRAAFISRVYYHRRVTRALRTASMICEI